MLVRSCSCALALLFACTSSPLVWVDEGSTQGPDALDFGATPVGFSRTQSLRLTNSFKVAKIVMLSTEAPFVVPSSIEIMGGEGAEVQVRFRPTRVGSTRATLMADELEITLTGEGVEPPLCTASNSCVAPHFDADSLACIEDPVADGTACVDEGGCLVGHCLAGNCLGQVKNCDDRNLCTRDSCVGGTGCRHDPVECAVSNPCLASTCDPARGCASAPVADGTTCGDTSCELAHVCITGVCRGVIPPDGFECAPATLCRGRGVCRDKQCEVPAEQPLTQKWSYVPRPDLTDFRFEGVSDDQGHFYWVECSRQPGGSSCEAVSLTPQGIQRFRTPVVVRGEWGQAPERTQLVTDGMFLFAVGDTLVTARADTGALVRTLNFRGNVIGLMAADGQGGLWVATHSPNSALDPWLLFRVLLSTGQTSPSIAIREPTSLAATPNGDAVLNVLNVVPRTAVPVRFLERYGINGRLLYSVPVHDDDGSAIAMLIDDEIVPSDDSVRSASDGGELLRFRMGTASVPVSPAWSTTGLNGVSPPEAGLRYRLSRLGASHPTSGVMGLHVLDGGAHVELFRTSADNALGPFLTANGDALFLTTDVPATEDVSSRVWLVSRQGRRHLSCTLEDARQLNGAVPVLPGKSIAFNGQQLAVLNRWDICESCRGPRSVPRVLVYDLARSAPGLAQQGWVAPRGTVGASGRAR